MTEEQQKTFERYLELIHKKFVTGFDSDSDSDELDALDDAIENAGHEAFYNGEENPYPQLTEAHSTWQYGYENAEVLEKYQQHPHIVARKMRLRVMARLGVRSAGKSLRWWGSD